MTTNPTTYEYRTTRDGHGTVHLVRSDDAIRFPNPPSLCGKHQKDYDLWMIGDETQSGIATTCKRCRTIAHVGR